MIFYIVFLGMLVVFLGAIVILVGYFGAVGAPRHLLLFCGFRELISWRNELIIPWQMN